MAAATPRRTVQDLAPVPPRLQGGKRAALPPHLAVGRALLAGVVGEDWRFERVTNQQVGDPVLGALCRSWGRVPIRPERHYPMRHTRSNKPDVLRTEIGAGEDLGVSKWTIRRLREEGELAYVVVRHSIRIPQSEIEAYKARRTVAARTSGGAA